MSKIPKTKDTTARTALIAIVIAIAIFAAIPAAALYYFGSSKEYCHDYAEKNAKTPADGVTDSRDMEKTELNDKCMSDRGFGGF